MSKTHDIIVNTPADRDVLIELFDRAVHLMGEARRLQGLPITAAHPLRVSLNGDPAIGKTEFVKAYFEKAADLGETDFYDYEGRDTQQRPVRVWTNWVSQQRELQIRSIDCEADNTGPITNAMCRDDKEVPERIAGGIDLLEHGERYNRNGLPFDLRLHFDLSGGAILNPEQSTILKRRVSMDVVSANSQTNNELAAFLRSLKTPEAA